MQSKRFYFLILILLIGVLACNLPQKVDVEIKKIYDENCSGCHGTQLQHFKRLKSYEKPLETLTNIIKIGNTNLGMPAYGKTYTDKQINELALYIKNFDYSENHQAETSENPNYTYEVIVDNLGIPWSFEFLPNGEILIAEKRGVLSLYSATAGKTTISGLPTVRDEGQGGLLDLKLHPDYETNGWIYISYSYKDGNNGNTAIIRAKLNNSKTALIDIEEIYKGTPATSKGYHFGNRMVFDAQNRIYFSNGDRGNRDGFPQTLDNTNGKIHRLNDDGSVPQDNPFVNDANAIASIYSYGHRNPQGLAVHPETGAIWEHEHGPKGGDEINIIEAGKNYGWPVISYGVNYSGTSFTDITEKEGMEQPVHYYVPSIAPCGMTFLNSDIYPDWKNNLFIGSLKFEYLERIVLNDNQVVYQEKILEELNSRVRDVRVGIDGYLYVSVENPGRIVKILPK